MVEEQAALRVRQVMDARVSEVLGSDVVQQTLQRRLEEERKDIERRVEEVCVWGGGEGRKGVQCEISLHCPLIVGAVSGVSFCLL